MSMFRENLHPMNNGSHATNKLQTGNECMYWWSFSTLNFYVLPQIIIHLAFLLKYNVSGEYLV
jgi:hypothetical protein